MEWTIVDRIACGIFAAGVHFMLWEHAAPTRWHKAGILVSAAFWLILLSSKRII
jgi:hypothetical protein